MNLHSQRGKDRQKAEMWSSDGEHIMGEEGTLMFNSVIASATYLLRRFRTLVPASMQFVLL